MVKAKIRKQVKQRANGRCEDCGRRILPNETITGHLNHVRDKNYTNPGNLVNRCLLCETEYHLKYSNDPQEIGLTKKHNDATILGHFKRLAEEEQTYLVDRYALLLEGVFKRLNLTDSFGII